ncbi:MAG TPA: MATE family efflux transporter [Petrotogaceae bacterium]|jgi:Na+-driven multidrug efflux pump|nr:MATE family efflux transporter [Petrotogaceae bacterium]HQO12462.1 MATE family efflux transporter [Petrotogaceae bacterium]
MILAKFKSSMKTIDYKLFGTLLFMALLPTIYTTVRIFFLGAMPNDSGLNIASQLSWVQVIYEIIDEAIMLPLFYLIGKSLKNKEELSNKIFSGLFITFIIYFIISLVFLLFAEPLILLMKQKTDLLERTAIYIRWESVALVFSVLARFIILVFTSLDKKKGLLSILSIQMILSIILDIFFVSSLPFSLNVGVNGIAYTNIIVNLSIFLLGLFILTSDDRIQKPKISLSWVKKWSKSWIKEWSKVGIYSAAESFVRNIVFMLMIVRMINLVGEQGTFWVANNFIWRWLLLPILCLGDLIKKDCAKDVKNAIEEKTLGYFGITSIVVGLWLITIPLWEPFIRIVMNISNSQDVFKIALISVFFYIVFAYNNVVDSIFYGIGKTNYMLVQSVLVNVIFYGIVYYLYLNGLYIPSLYNIAIIFGLGILFDSIITFCIFGWMLKKEKIKIL